MDMLRNITAGSSAASNPLLKSLLGPNASAAEYQALAQQAESMWKMMDEMAESDPGAYADFIKVQAQAAQEEAERSKDPRVEGIAPALVLEAQAAQQAPGAPAVAAGGGAAASVVAGVVAPGQAVARVHIWAATDASGIRPPHLAGGAALQPGAAPPADWSGLTVPLAEYRPARSQPGPVPVHHFHLACSGAAVRMCVAAGPPAFRAAFLEAVSQFVEAEYGLALSRGVRTLQVNREALGEEDLRRLLESEEAHSGAHTSQVPEAAAAGTAADEPALPKGLLDELRSMGGSKPSKPRGGQAPGPGPGAARRAPLIEELDA